MVKDIYAHGFGKQTNMVTNYLLHLNVLVSLQQAGDIAMDAGQLQHALELYQAGKV